jgi:hypothetical protein
MVTQPAQNGYFATPIMRPSDFSVNCAEVAVAGHIRAGDPGV